MTYNELKNLKDHRGEEQLKSKTGYKRWNKCIFSYRIQEITTNFTDQTGL